MDEGISDTAAIAALARGDGSAVEILLSRHGELAAGIAFRVLRNSSLAEDAVQEAFVDLWRTAASFNVERGSVRSWICVLTHRRAVDIARREARRHDFRGASPGTLPPDSYTLEELVILRTDRRRVQSALGRLAPRDRTLVELAYYGGLTQTQVADRLSLPLGTVKSATFEALKRLRLMLEPAPEPT